MIRGADSGTPVRYKGVVHIVKSNHRVNTWPSSEGRIVELTLACGIIIRPSKGERPSRRYDKSTGCKACHRWLVVEGF